MLDRHAASYRINPEAPQPHPIADDAWSEVAIAACLPPSALAARRRARAAGEEVAR
jgi:hypothetical protein